MQSDELTLFRDMARRAFEQEISPHYEQWEEEHMVPRELWRTLGAAGLLCADMDEAYGGAGTTPHVTLMLIEELSRMGFGGFASGFGIHSNIVAPYLARHGTEEQKQQWLPKMVSGDAVGALAMTEPGAGSDVQGIRTNAVRDGDEWILNGSKIFITNGMHADLVIVAAITDPGKGAKGTSLFLVDTALPGFERGKKIEKIGQHASDTALLFFQDMRLPANALLGQENKGFAIMMEELPRERLGIAAQAVAAAEGALALTVDYVLERKAFGQAIGSFQNTRFKLADVRTEIALNRALYEQCADEYSRGELTADKAAMLKLASCEMQCDTIDECLQLFGGYGYTVEYPISRFYTDARIQRIYGGSSEIMRELVARSILGRA
ncbi:MAG TPA: acyl-CoA dehydrogenase [Haliea salexigens]|uniref:Acyl-[acyl-carrier-protein] dehydrogenase MbtN n=1 Tax=Haliea salexigens TaxID=287487 RepID=A0A3C1KI84_9GAMM|nr:acyl-CoA dehydrogenase family protein [Haliea salexigens]MAA86159.1 acyl-CoA dehydrogenase [Haliea sp.]HAN26335.1 acyl-CoA dehydrogenase [Haliea salexigens]|tara:strand:+ start:11134 stop:12273 length:1140 start_codon:yes stop_codon:yes gene_type:complete